MLALFKIKLQRSVGKAVAAARIRSIPVKDLLLPAAILVARGRIPLVALVHEAAREQQAPRLLVGQLAIQIQASFDGVSVSLQGIVFKAQRVKAAVFCVKTVGDAARSGGRQGVFSAQHHMGGRVTRKVGIVKGADLDQRACRSGVPASNVFFIFAFRQGRKASGLARSVCIPYAACAKRQAQKQRTCKQDCFPFSRHRASSGL